MKSNCPDTMMRMSITTMMIDVQHIAAALTLNQVMGSIHVVICLIDPAHAMVIPVEGKDHQTVDLQVFW